MKIGDRERAEALHALFTATNGYGATLINRDTARLFREFYPDLEINYVNKISELKPGLNAYHEH